MAGVQIIPQGCACSRARSLEEILEVTQFIILQERTVEHVDDVTSASDTGTNSGSREEHSTRAGPIASWSRSWSASATDHAVNAEVVQLVLFAGLGKSRS